MRQLITVCPQEIDEYSPTPFIQPRAHIRHAFSLLDPSENSLVHAQRCVYSNSQTAQHSPTSNSRRPEPRCASQWLGCLPSMCEALAHSPAPHNPAVVSHACFPSTQKSEAEGPGDQNHPPELYNKSEACQGSMRPCLLQFLNSERQVQACQGNRVISGTLDT